MAAQREVGSVTYWICRALGLVLAYVVATASCHLMGIETRSPFDPPRARVKAAPAVVPSFRVAGTALGEWTDLGEEAMATWSADLEIRGTVGLGDAAAVVRFFDADGREVHCAVAGRHLVARSGTITGAVRVPVAVAETATRYEIHVDYAERPR